jgi:hypothetical protein
LSVRRVVVPRFARQAAASLADRFAESGDLLWISCYRAAVATGRSCRLGGVMAELRTKPTDTDVDAFLATLDPARQEDCRTLVALMHEATGAPPVLWGASIVGFGQYHYRYPTGQEGDWFLVGFSPRRSALTLYIMPGFARYETLMARLGHHTTGKSCLYLKRLSDVHADVLRELVFASVAQLRATYPD